MVSMSPELELMIFMTPIFTAKAELALEVFKGGTFCVCTVCSVHTGLPYNVKRAEATCKKLTKNSNLDLGMVAT